MNLSYIQGKSVTGLATKLNQYYAYNFNVTLRQLRLSGPHSILYIYGTLKSRYEMSNNCLHSTSFTSLYFLQISYFRALTSFLRKKLEPMWQRYEILINKDAKVNLPSAKVEYWW